VRRNGGQKSALQNIDTDRMGQLEKRLQVKGGKFELWEFVKNNLLILIGFYPILTDDALSGLWFF
jgi:hypothetical protein